MLVKTNFLINDCYWSFVILTIIVLQNDMLLLFVLTSISVISFCESDQFVAYEVLKKKESIFFHGLPQNTRTNIIALYLKI